MSKWNAKSVEKQENTPPSKPQDDRPMGKNANLGRQGDKSGGPGGARGAGGPGGARGGGGPGGARGAGGPGGARGGGGPGGAKGAGGPGGAKGGHKEAMQAAREHLKSKNYDEAIKAFEAILEEDSEAIQAYIDISNVYSIKGEYDNALEYLAGALHIRKDFSPALMMSGSVYLKMGQKDKALDKFNAALSSNPDLERAHVNIARILATQNKVPEAINTMKEALKHNPQSEIARLTLAGFFEQEGNIGAAIKEHRSVIAQDHQSWKAYFRLGRLYLSQKKYRESIDACKESIKLKPENTELVHIVLGSAYTGAGQHELALKEFDEVLESDGSLVNAKIGVAKVYIEQGKMDEAKKILLQLTKGNRVLANVHILLAEIMLLEGYFDLAVAQFQAAILKNKKFLENHPELVNIGEKESDDEKLAIAYKTAFDSVKDRLAME